MAIEEARNLHVSDDHHHDARGRHRRRISRPSDGSLHDGGDGRVPDQLGARRPAVRLAHRAGHRALVRRGRAGVQHPVLQQRQHEDHRAGHRTPSDGSGGACRWLTPPRSRARSER